MWYHNMISYNILWNHTWCVMWCIICFTVLWYTTVERITMINATSSLDYQYVSETAGRVAVAGIAVYFCAKWARTPAESLHVMISLPTYDIIGLDMISWLFLWYHAIYDGICNIWHHSILMISYVNLWHHTSLWYHGWCYDIPTNIWYHSFGYDIMVVSMISYTYDIIGNL